MTAPTTLAVLTATDGLDPGERLEALLEQLEPALPDPPYGCWVRDEHGLASGESYCKRCAGRVADGLYVTGLLADDPGLDPQDYGVELPEVCCSYEEFYSEGCEHCARCGKLLAYALSGHGVGEELDHFEGCPPMADPDCLYHVAKLMEGAGESGDPELIARAVAVGKQAVAALDRARGRTPEQQLAGEPG